MNVFVFDIETIPDVAGARRLWGLEGLDDEGVASVMYSKRQQETGGTSDFLRHHFEILRFDLLSILFKETGAHAYNLLAFGDR